MAYNPDVPSFDNYGVEDLNKMRENFQILANIATRREDILSLAVETGDILDSRIVEHNLIILSPSNGYYVRWENGLQVCWHSDVRRFPIESKYGDTFYYGQVTWHFPAVFLDCRYAHMIVRTQPRLILSALASNVLPVEEYVYFFAISTETIPEEDRQLGFIAIGRWK